MARILVVDDNAPLAGTMAQYLEMEGHDVDQAHDGETALAKAGARVPDVVILDVNIPELDGFATCRAITALSPDTAVLLVTGRSDEGDPQRAEDSGARALLTKPVSLAQLSSEIHKVLAKR